MMRIDVITNVTRIATTGISVFAHIGAAARSILNFFTIKTSNACQVLICAGHQQADLFRSRFYGRHNTFDAAFVNNSDAVGESQYFIQVL